MSEFKTIEELKGETLVKVESGFEEVIFDTASGKRFRMYHEQDCCEGVFVTGIIGDLQSLVGEEITAAKENISHDEPDGNSRTLTNFVIGTRLGEVTIKWEGTSNGWYGEGVYFIQLP